MNEDLSRSARHFEALVTEQLERVERMKQSDEPLDFASLNPLVIGVSQGDGIGPVITRETLRVIEHLLGPALAAGEIVLRRIEGLSIENRVRRGEAIPEGVLEELKACHVILKAPLATPETGGTLPNLESANVALRRELDLFANVRPVRVPSLGIDWVFFRENTEGPYLLGSRGLLVTPELAFDFSVVSRPGCVRIIRLAFEHARRHGLTRVTGVTKANIIKATDGMFLEVGERLAREYPEIRWDTWHADIMAAKLLDAKRRGEFQVLVLPNLYGDILTDEAAELQGGVGAVGSANLGARYAMFEAIHGSAPRMVSEGRAEYADPSSLMRATALLLGHVGRRYEAVLLDRALDLVTQIERPVVLTGREDGATATRLTDHVLTALDRPDVREHAQALAATGLER